MEGAAVTFEPMHAGKILFRFVKVVKRKRTTVERWVFEDALTAEQQPTGDAEETGGAGPSGTSAGRLLDATSKKVNSDLFFGLQLGGQNPPKLAPKSWKNPYRNKH